MYNCSQFHTNLPILSTSKVFSGPFFQHPEEMQCTLPSQHSSLVLTFPLQAKLALLL